jgi:hypothetical protein
MNSQSFHRELSRRKTKKSHREEEQKDVKVHVKHRPKLCRFQVDERSENGMRDARLQTIIVQDLLQGLHASAEQQLALIVSFALHFDSANLRID